MIIAEQSVPAVFFREEEEMLGISLQMSESFVTDGTRLSYVFTSITKLFSLIWLKLTRYNADLSKFLIVYWGGRL